MRLRTPAGLLLLCVACLPLSASAQRGEATANYSYIFYNPAKSIAPHRHFNGGGGSLGFNLGEFVTLKGEFEGYSTTTLTWNLTAPPAGVATPGTFTTKADMFTYLFGPQFNAPGTKVRPFGEALFGGASTNAYTNLFKAANVVGLKASNTGFAFAIGGGFDVPVSKHLAVRVAQFDYFLTRYEFKALGINNQSNFRYQAGLVFGFARGPGY